jgi:hypothetical protein
MSTTHLKRTCPNFAGCTESPQNGSYVWIIQKDRIDFKKLAFQIIYKI